MHRLAIRTSLHSIFKWYPFVNFEILATSSHWLSTNSIFFLEYRLIKIPYDHSLFLEILWYGTTNTKPLLLRSLSTSFAVIRETSLLVLRNSRNPFVMVWSLEYLHPIFFNISYTNCHFSVDLSLDFIFTMASIIDNICTLKQSGLEWHKAQKH